MAAVRTGILIEASMSISRARTSYMKVLGPSGKLKTIGKVGGGRMETMSQPGFGKSFLVDVFQSVFMDISGNKKKDLGRNLAEMQMGK